MSKVNEKQRNFTIPLILGSTLFRIGFFLFGLYQDAHMEVKYTDIDYLVFSDAAKYVYEGGSPYQRETYRYTPLLAWLLIPNAVDEKLYSFGKILFIISDLITGVLILKILDLINISQLKKLILSSIWLLNPMVITISTRGSSESVLTVFIMAFVYLLIKQKVILSGLFAGLAIHFKIYPIIYIPTAVIYLSNTSNSKGPYYILALINKKSILFTISSVISFTSLGTLMYKIYGYEFLEHSYIYHLSRLDHRHNFSVYNISLYFASALKSTTNFEKFTLDFTTLAFLPQLVISAIILPFVFTKKSLTTTLFLQTLTFVTYNKVMTSQYFIWFLIFLPFSLRNSKLLGENKVQGITCLLLWIISQSSWLFFAYKLEFLGENTFFPGLLLSSSFFFLSNNYVLGTFIDDLNRNLISDGI
ncbi:GPI mannosyltransferase 1 [Wickerhamomyces ciferrii]|uniref:GPI mannosyltransferase 1 n=1 Tax=Wickerhamomyces ciferrii (strain ATCC 14091 / BCRC 22168 / CBS 111 / JCM 3599 / NBRC 0793 / NRRL Y-1031 F-60-10) TaxID=1206466 RepID=K0KIJ2_WICCF|nr:GPI mannosyltransferase 1 [Wickerhamomyces ciferrii]CCH45040.1 GPI mannosyltransferase 1 [Wickerhamomyces ciferrii]